MGFVDPGGGHVHNIRSEDTVEARTVLVQIIPAAICVLDLVATSR